MLKTPLLVTRLYARPPREPGEVAEATFPADLYWDWLMHSPEFVNAGWRHGS